MGLLGTISVPDFEPDIKYLWRQNMSIFHTVKTLDTKKPAWKRA